MDKAQRTSKTTLYALVFNLFADKPPGLVGILISYFSSYFFLFFRTHVKQAPNKKICTLNKGGMWSTKNQARFLKIRKQLQSFKTLFF